MILHVKCTRCEHEMQVEGILDNDGLVADTNPPLVCPECGWTTFSLRLAIDVEKWKGVYGTHGGSE